MSSLPLTPAALSLSPEEESSLSRLEIVIEDGLASFVRVGEALLDIRSKRLYRDDFTTFEDYCRERWDLSESYANYKIQAAEVTTIVVDAGLPAPRSESQTRELAPLLAQPEALVEAYAEVVKAHPEPTAANVREVAQRKTGAPLKPDPAPFFTGWCELVDGFYGGWRALSHAMAPEHVAVWREVPVEDRVEAVATIDRLISQLDNLRSTIEGEA